MEPKFNKFITFTLSPEEERIGSKFHPLQQAVIHNERAKIAMNLVNQEIPSSEEGGNEKYLKDRLFLQGQLAFADFIIELSKKYSDEDLQKSQEPQPQ